MASLEEYGRKLVDYRKERNLTYEQFAEYLSDRGFSAHTTQVFRWEKVKPFPYACMSADRLNELLRILNLLETSPASRKS